MTYKVFVDDSGSKEYFEPYNPYLIEDPLPFEGNELYWRNNYFVLTGIRVEQEDLGKVDGAIRKLKVDCFGTEDVEIKSVWLRYPDKQEAKYLKPYGLTKERLLKFGNDYMDAIASFSDEVKILAVVVDKRYFKYRGKVNNAPLLRATQVLLERVCQAGGETTLVFDQMDTSTSKWRGDNNKILGVYLTNARMEQIYISEYTNITDCTFGDSSKDNMLQIADVCAYCVYRQFVMYGPEWSQQRDNETLDVYSYFRRIADNFYRSPYPSHRNKVVGYGLSVIPNTHKLNWQFVKESLED
jgi:hypothetical protein